MLKTSELFDLSRTLAAPLLGECEYPWQALGRISDFIKATGAALDSAEYDNVSENVWIARTATVAPTASITGPCIIGPETQVRHCAFIRGAALVGAGCVVGNSTELKNVILFDGVQVPHYNYVGDSVLGYKAHMGAGSITSNVKSDKSCVCIFDGASRADTGRKKVGAMLGDNVEIGCNSVLCPGATVGRGASVYPLSLVRGTIPAGCIYKGEGNIIPRRQDV